ncbi:MAG: hypothetical protein KBC41_00940 [Candidatus Pacebacteria bacterium]|nr:hypothetical protein [Candidatus Paceibacterota bacterium]MBP9866629.1 hypothetical protein [Candidatus Paceibacterota bacterium]
MNFFIMLLSIIGMFGCSEKEQQAYEKKVIEKSIAVIPTTREDRKNASLEALKTAKEEKAGDKKTINLGPLAGRKLGDLYAKYLGLPNGSVPPHTDISFDENLSKLFEQKINFEKCNKKGVCKESTETVLSKVPELYENYLISDRKKMSFKNFVSVANQKVASGKKSLDWNKLCKHYKLTQEKCQVNKAVISNLQGKDLIAYGMTELLPSSEGRLNVEYMDVLLQNAGAEFVYNIPALGDGLTSIGFYQFTMYAVRKDNQSTDGASIVNAFVKEGGDKIADSVVKLKGHEHHTAAFYFAVHNLSRLVASLSPKGVTILKEKHGNYQDEIVMYIAAAHHAPEPAKNMTKAWIQKNMSKSIFAAYGKHRIAPYALKTKSNLLAVYQNT